MQQEVQDLLGAIKWFNRFWCRIQYLRGLLLRGKLQGLPLGVGLAKVDGFRFDLASSLTRGSDLDERLNDDVGVL